MLSVNSSSRSPGNFASAIPRLRLPDWCPCSLANISPLLLNQLWIQSTSNRSPPATTVTFGLGSNGSMGWSARFIQMPFLRGTNGTVPISGTRILQIDLTSVDSTHGASPGQPMRLTPDDDASAVVQVLSYPSSDTVTHSFVGTRSSTPEVTVGTFLDNRAITFTITH